MPYVTTTDGVELYYEETGSGTPIIFAHEFGGDYRHWEPQMRFFSRSHRCIAFNARGYPPSAIPEDPGMYSQNNARDDVLAILDGLDIEKAHINGLSMGGFASLHFGFEYPDRALSLVVAGCGYGAKSDHKEQFVRETTEVADRMENETMAVFGKVYALGPTRVQFQNKDPRGWQEFEQQICEHSRRRPSLYDLEDKMHALKVPTLVINGDEDDPCLDAGLYMKRNIVSSALVLLPRTGHLCNLEEPILYNQICGDFMQRVESGRWEMRDPRSMTTSIISTPGM